jgi:L-lactate dehydrogenase complex protein LldG
MNATLDENPLTLEFIEKASLVSAKVYQAKDVASALDKALEICLSKPPCESQMPDTDAGASVSVSAGTKDLENLRVMATPNLGPDDFTRFSEDCQDTKNIRLIQEDLRAWPGGIDMGVTLMDFGIAETGTLVLNSDSEETRLSTMLCETHVAILRKSRIRETALSMADELTELTRQPSSYTAFITGASRTADIERVLALGVHGPLELIIMLVEG